VKSYHLTDIIILVYLYYSNIWDFESECWEFESLRPHQQEWGGITWMGCLTMKN